MAQESVKRSAIIYAGYQYQTLQGIRLLVEWLSSPTRYLKIQFECNDEVGPKGIDDIVVLRSDNRYDFYQIKYTPSPSKEENSLCWDWLLEVNTSPINSRSLLRKLFDAVNKVGPQVLGEVRLITNRIPDRDVERCLREGNRLNYSLLSPEAKLKLNAQLGGEEVAQAFLNILEVVHSDKSYLSLESELNSDLRNFTDDLGIERLKNKAREWSTFNEPGPDGWITLPILRSLLSTFRSEAISEDFVIPKRYTVPDEEFHQQMVENIKNRRGKVFTIVGPPGRGKSTYLSFLCQVLDELDIPTIRHHYFLSVRDGTRDRLSPYVVVDSLLSQIERFHSQTGTVSPNINERLHKYLELCANYYGEQGKPFVVMIDGLDHVWRNNSHDKRPLDEIFNQILPLAPNVILVIGTQPVDNEELPERLLLESPRMHWRELPPMSGHSVLSYLQSQVENGRLHFPREQDIESQLIECGQSLHRLTRGHPLHVIYSIEELVGSNTPLSPWKIEELPACPGDNIRDYYLSLWMRLMHVEQDVLHLLCAFPFYWPTRAFNEIDLDPEILQVSIRKVEHLLQSTSAGLKPFHESLIVFVTERSDYIERIGSLAPKVESWLRDYAPEILRESWLWTIQAKNGNTKPLREGLTRDWVLDRLANGYPVNTPVRLLSEAEGYSFQEKDYSEAYRLRALKTRLLNGPEFQIDDQSRLRSCSWKLSNDPLVLEDAFASRHELSTQELATLALAITWHGNKGRGRMIMQEAFKRYRGEWRFSQINHDESRKEIVSLIMGGVTLLVDYLEWVIRDKVFNKWPHEYVEALVFALASEQRLEWFIALRSSIDNSERAKLVEVMSMRVAALAGADISAWSEFKSFDASCLTDCWAIVMRSPLNRIFTPNGSLSVNLFNNRYLESQKFQDVVHEWFFGAVLTKLIASGELNWIPTPEFEAQPNLSGYLDSLILYAEWVADKILNREAVDFSDLFLFYDQTQIPRPKGFDESQAYESFRRALLQVAIDCHLLSSAFREETHINSSSIRRAEASHWFSLSAFCSRYVKVGLQILTDEAADYVVRTGQSELLSKIGETKQTVGALLELCELSLMHRLTTQAAPICRLCWDFVLGYDSHKDPTILNVLKAIEYCADVDPVGAKEALFQIAPQIQHVTEYTDGDETRYAHNYASEILCKVDQFSFMNQYKEFMEEGDWYRADEGLVEFFESADLTSPIIEGLMRTGLSSSVMAVLSKRAEAGDMTANRLLLIASQHMGVNVSTFGSEPQGGSNTQLYEFAGNPDDYPPEKFDVLLEDMTASHTFSAYNYLPKWYEHWKSKGQESALLRILTGRLLGKESRREDTHYMLDQLFESCVRLKGKREAFNIIVKAQIELGGWIDYFEQSEKSEARLQRVAKLYPERADEFIAKSASNWLTSWSQPSTLVIPGDKLVFFLIQLERLDEAFGLIQSMTNCLKEDTRNLNLSLPAWAQLR